jgi:molybdopterin-guanine dinucleotide biosynthesis protein MobB
MEQGSVSLAILAGGRSRRMGQDKAFAEFGGGTLIEWVLDRVAGLFPHAFIVAKEVSRYRDLGLPVVADALPASSPTVGVYSAVLAAPTDRTLCLGCDLPFVTPEVLIALAERSAGHEALVPCDGGWLQPLCAVYSRATLGALEEMLTADERRIDLIFERVATEYVDVAELGLGDSGRLFLNVNTQAELAAAREIADRGAAAAAAAAATGQVRDGCAAPDGAAAPRPLAPRVEEFMATVALPTVSFVGKKKSGKTTALAGVIAELAGRGRRVAAVKHDMHGFSIDMPGTDSHRLREAGADVTVVSSPEDVAIMSAVGEDLPLASLVARIREPIDIVLTEGFMRQPAPKFEISRAERSATLIAPPDEVLGVIADQPFRGHPAPQYAIDDYAAVADAIDILSRRWRVTRASGTKAVRDRHASRPDDAVRCNGNDRPEQPGRGHRRGR